LTWHNLAWTLDLVRRTRSAIEAGTLATVRRQVGEVYQ
jgi:queuine/archaeosine tRNA-ribosyltransferase